MRKQDSSVFQGSPRALADNSSAIELDYLADNPVKSTQSGRGRVIWPAYSLPMRLVLCHLDHMSPFHSNSNQFYRWITARLKYGTRSLPTKVTQTKKP